MGKFGSFRANDVFGHPFDVPYEVYDGNRARRVKDKSYLHAFGKLLPEVNMQSRHWDVTFGSACRELERHRTNQCKGLINRFRMTRRHQHGRIGQQPGPGG